jgi:hypothetical protein
MASVPSWDLFQAQAKWEMSVKTRKILFPADFSSKGVAALE